MLAWDIREFVLKYHRGNGIQTHRNHAYIAIVFSFYH